LLVIGGEYNIYMLDGREDIILDIATSSVRWCFEYCALRAIYFVQFAN